MVLVNVDDMQNEEKVCVVRVKKRQGETGREKGGNDMLTTQQQDAILNGDASFYTFNLSSVWTNKEKWYYLYLENTYRRDGYGKFEIAYILSDNGVIFQGEDLGASPLHDPIGGETAEALLSFLTCMEGDVDDEYFANYNERQLEFRDCEAEDLWFWREELNPEGV